MIAHCGRQGFATVAAAVGSYIAAAYWFTASTSFANPAVTIARALTDTFAGIRPEDAPGFIGAQCAGAALATAMAGWLGGTRGGDRAPDGKPSSDPYRIDLSDSSRSEPQSSGCNNPPRK